jgi:outer membrane protein insertion porin family
MKSFSRLFGTCVLLGYATAGWSQTVGPKIDRVDIKYIGPTSVSEQFIRSNIRLKAGDPYRPNNTQDDVHSLYSTGEFYNIRVGVEQADDGGVILTYTVQARPRITDIKIVGNVKLKDSRLKKKITVKVGDPLDEQKLFSDVQEIQKLYEKYGHPDTHVQYIQSIDENTGHATITFQIVETPKTKITDIEFIGAAAFTPKDLRKQLKTSERWWMSWLTGSGVLKQEDFDDDRDRLVDYYREHGYLDFEIKDIKLEHPLANTLAIKFYVYEGRQYKVGSIKVTGNTVFSSAQIQQGLVATHEFQHAKGKLGPNGFPMDVGDVFSPSGLTKDQQAIEDFYGGKGYIDVSQGEALRVIRIPNVDTGAMDLEFQVDENQKYVVEKIDIRGNLKTKDKVIRRELAISPGETFDMVRVKISKDRLEQLQFFDKVDLQPEPTDPPITGRKNLVVNLEEQNTGNFTLGAGFSSVDALVGYVEVSQSNFDLFNPPNFTGAGQKMRVRVQLGTQRQDYEISFVEPWFLNRKLSLGVDLYRHQLDFESPNNIYTETRTGMRLSLTRALGSDFLIGSVSYTLEDVGIGLNGGYTPIYSVVNQPNDPFPNGAGGNFNRNVPYAILDQLGDHLYQRFGSSLAYDTRNSYELATHGQRSEVEGEYSLGSQSYYKLQAKTSWYFPGFFHRHVWEIDGEIKVADSINGGDVPFYDRYYLGGLYSLRGFKYRNISPREAFDQTAPSTPTEPIGGDTSWFGSVNYSLPIFEKDGGVGLRFEMFYDVGYVDQSPYSISGQYDDNWGLGLLLNIPHLGPLRLEYGIPLTHDAFNGSSGQFQFGVGFNRPF